MPGTAHADGGLATGGRLRSGGAVLEGWRATFVLVGLPGLLIAAMMLTVREPGRRNEGGPSVRGAHAWSAVWNFLAERRSLFLRHFGAFALFSWLVGPGGYELFEARNLTLLFLVVFAAWRIYRAGVRGRSGWDAGLGAGLLCSQLALAVHGMLDAPVWGAHSALVVWGLWALSMASYNLRRVPADGT